MWHPESPTRMGWRSCGLVTVVALVAACGGEKKASNASAGGGTTAAGMAAGTTSAAAPAAPAGTTAAPAGAAAPAGSTATSAGGGGGAAGAKITPRMVAEGDSVFHGTKAGGLCYTCHGPDAKGTQLAPPLRPHKWLTGDGSYQFIVQRVTQGVPNPTPPYTTPMPPLGGAPLTPDQVKAVAAYVYSLSHPVKS